MSRQQPPLRRSSRQAAKPPAASARTSGTDAAHSATAAANHSSPLGKGKRKGKVPVDQEGVLRSLLQSPKSILTSIDISVGLSSSSAPSARTAFGLPKMNSFALSIQDVLDPLVWEMLSGESRSTLKPLLPPTAFVGYCPKLGRDHPAAQADMDVDPSNGNGAMTDEVDAAALFTDAHFLAAARTFQDHLYSNWLSDAHREKIDKFESDLRNGSLAVRWKDEQWLEDNPPAQPEAESTATVDASGSTASWDLTLAG